MKCPKCLSENPADTKICGECGASLPSPKDHPSVVTETLQSSTYELATGSTFAGRYQVIEELGHGGMGRVYKVFDIRIKEKVALKLIKPGVAADQDTIDRFRNEIRLARRISHRNVCRMFDIGEADGAHFITMEYVQGEDLKSMIHMSGSLSIGAVLSVGKQVCDGLAEAHGLGVVHRDLKPQNIMIDRRGNAKIMDFGIARSVREKGITGPSVMIGTPEYMSPEQAEAKEVDHRSDVYSLGVILYEMATSHVPFTGETALSIAMKHKGEIPKNPKQLNPQIPDDLSGVILKCLEKDKGKRYQNAASIRSELEKIEKGIPTTERVAPAKPGTHRIGVLPFVDDSPEKVHAYLCEGIPNTLINALNSIQNLRVPARTSAFSFVGKDLSIQEIGQKLNVENVLEGSIQVVGDSLRVTASLIKVKDGYQLWNSTYDRKLEDVFTIQDEIAQAIVRALKIRLLDEQGERLVKRYTENLEAYKFYLQGLYYWNKRTGKDLAKAIELLNLAINEDPNYALAYVGLADSYNLLTIYGDARPQDTYPRAKGAATKALEINEALSEAHNSLAYVFERYDWNWEAAEAEFKRALELDPNCATAHFWYGELLMYFGRSEESIMEMKRALELDPVSLVINAILGSAYLMARQFDQAIAQLHHTLEMDPNFALAHLELGNAYLAKLQFSAAIDELKKAREFSGDAVMMVGTLGVAYARAGKLEEAEGILAELMARSQKQHVSPYWIGRVFGAMGDVEKLFELWDRAYEERTESLIEIKSDPMLDSFRPDPRYGAILHKMGFE